MAATEADLNTAAIEAIGLSKNYAGKAVLSDVSFRIEPGEVVTLLGPSGAGKTTLFRCLTQLALPDRGRILWFGRAVTDMRRRELRSARRKDRSEIGHRRKIQSQVSPEVAGLSH